MNFEEFPTWVSQENRRPLVMGVINVTPDSFSDGGQIRTARKAAAVAEQMIADGADWIDIGGESTRPGAQRVLEDEQIRRTAGAIQAIRAKIRPMISIDTTRSKVAAAALDAGANVINDISAGGEDPAMLALAGKSGAAIILMHMQGSPMTMQLLPAYDDVTADVSKFLIERAAAARSAGVAQEKILIDPGIGFGKTAMHNLQLLRDTKKLAGLGWPVVVGASRKSFIGKIIGQPGASDRIFGTAAAVAWSIANGAAVVRVHDVKAMAQVVRMIGAIDGKNVPTL